MTPQEWLMLLAAVVIGAAIGLTFGRLQQWWEERGR